MTKLTGEQAGLLLAAGRIFAGVGAWLMPGIAVRVFGAHPQQHPPAMFIARTFAARDLAMGVGQASAEGAERDRWLTLGAMVDAMDGVAALLAVRRRHVPAAKGLPAAATAAAAVALGLRARRP